MIVGILAAVALIAMLCVLAYRLATYALPFMAALAAFRFAHDTGAGIVGAALVGLVVAALSFAILAFLFAAVRAPILRLAIAVIFAAPAAIAGYALVNGIAAEIVPSPIWRLVFSVIGAVAVSLSALARLAAPLSADDR